MDKAMDKIIIRNISAETVLGIYRRERRNRRKILVTVEISCELRKAGETDRIRDTVNYKTLKDEIEDFASKSKFKLIESLAEGIARICLAHPMVIQAKVSIEKPDSLKGAEGVAVEILRSK
jgi:FolB domain-containing protein